jgi:dipeptidyl aminopeptidase/acylaminoacyl peptidase
MALVGPVQQSNILSLLEIRAFSLVSRFGEQVMAHGKPLNSKVFRVFSAPLALLLGAVAAGVIPSAASAQAGPQATADLAARFGALEALQDVSLSPDGQNIAFISPSTGEGNDLFVVGTAEGSAPRRLLRASGAPESLRWCSWANNVRIVCSLGGREEVNGEIYGFSTVIAVDAAGGNVKSLSTRRGANALFADFRGGTVIDWLRDDDDAVLMMRSYVPEARIGSLVSRDEEGMGVDRVDIRTAAIRRVETPRRDAASYLTDGLGNVRIMAIQPFVGQTFQLSETVRYFYRPAAGGDWLPLATYNVLSKDGFQPLAVDPETDRAIGFQQVDGRTAVVAMPLDGTGITSVLFSHPEVDIDGLLVAGSTRRVVGASYVTDKRGAIVTDGPLRRMSNALQRALAGRAVHIADESDDRSQFLVWASSDVDAGRYYLYAPAARQLRPLLADRPALDGMTLSPVQPISYPAADGTMIPGYLTLPPGRTDARGIPAIVMPHGGPSSRDEWGFDWLAQYFAAQGYAVLQPNFRGSSGYGEDWYRNNGFQSWRTAIGDVTDGGRWLLSAHGVDPSKLSIVGWSYGGYAALQSAVIAPDLFRSVVAIAPVTDLPQLRREESRFITGRINRDYIGEGPHLREGSPAQNASAINVPVLMFHGSLDTNVDIEQARTMRRALQNAGRPVELIEYDGLAHNLGTAEARTDMLRRISAFLPR